MWCRRRASAHDTLILAAELALAHPSCPLAAELGLGGMMAAERSLARGAALPVSLDLGQHTQLLSIATTGAPRPARCTPR